LCLSCVLSTYRTISRRFDVFRFDYGEDGEAESEDGELPKTMKAAKALDPFPVDVIDDSAATFQKAARGFRLGHKVRKRAWPGQVGVIVKAGDQIL